MVNGAGLTVLNVTNPGVRGAVSPSSTAVAAEAAEARGFYVS